MKGKLVLICCFDGSLTKAQIDCIYKGKCLNTGREHVHQLISWCNSKNLDWYERLLDFLWQKNTIAETWSVDSTTLLLYELTQLIKMNCGSVSPRQGVENGSVEIQEKYNTHTKKTEKKPHTFLGCQDAFS